MPADLRLVAHSAQRQAYELPPRRLGDRHPQRRLAHARGPDEAQDRALGIFHQLPHREKFEDALLDLLQPVVVLVQDLLRILDGADLLRFLLPRHRQQPVEVIARDRRFRRHGRHRFQLLELVECLLLHFLGHSRAFDLLAQLIELALLPAPQLLLDRLDLLVEVILFLRALHLPLHPRLDGAVHVQLLDLDLEHVGDAVQPLHRVEDVQQLLLLFDRQLQVGRDRVGQLARVVHPHRSDGGLHVQRLRQLHILLKKRAHPLHRRLHDRRRLGE